MKMKKLLIAMLSFSLVSAYAEQVNQNGDFEKCKADGAGNLMPEAWSINKGVSKKYTISVTKEKADVHSGNFALEIETEKDGKLFVTNWKGIAIKDGDILDISIFAKGTGTFQLGYILYGVADGEKKDAFLYTVASSAMKPQEDKYKKFTYRKKITKIVKNKKTYNKLTAYPVILTGANSYIVMDDLVFDLISSPAQK